MTLRLFALGSNGGGQLGIGSQDDCSTPKKCQFQATKAFTDHETIAAIRGGGNHTMLLTSNGRVFETGSNSRFAAASNCFELVNVEGLFASRACIQVTHIAASWEASFLVVDGQVLFASGTGKKGELGLGKGQLATVRPEIVMDLATYGDGRATVQDVAAGLNHVVLITSAGEVYGWGNSRSGQLGEEAREQKNIWSPWRVDVGFHAISVVSGRNFTFVRGKGGQKLTLGNHKQAPNGEDLDLGKETVVSCGWSSIYAVNSGDLQALGHGRMGQVPQIGLSKLSLFAAGSEHCVGCTIDGQIIAFGWGEHGNCGEAIDGQGNVARSFNDIAVSATDNEHICFLGAGCATTFIAIKSFTGPA